MTNKITGIIAVVVTALAATTASLAYSSYKQAEQLKVFEYYIQHQQEIICMNKDSLPIQYQEHKDFCLGVAGSVALRH